MMTNSMDKRFKQKDDMYEKMDKQMNEKIKRLVE